ncbi:hypothetical protein EMPS_06813 [Entomortierella parvispora]|uniref:Uncharacterized protein n=1 Tax=Entomortierella parvispora TaxID=205924 RepID=A0A9P3LY33_9FUNG|nr:hypothetical protein EMPS_06813 [Entomortierella parvispora]
MKVYVVMKQESRRDENNKGSPVDSPTAVEVYRSNERAFRAAHNLQLKSLQYERIMWGKELDSEHDDDDDNPAFTYTRDTRDRNWEISFEKIQRLTKGEKCTLYTVQEHEAK